MCGFVVTTEGNKADKMIDRQRFRGPDARGETIRYMVNLTFAHVLLDISGENEIQPFLTELDSNHASKEDDSITRAN